MSEPRKWIRNLLLVIAACSLWGTGELRGQEAAAPPAANPLTRVYPLDIAVAADGTAYIVDRNLPGVWVAKEGKLSVFSQGSKKIRGLLNASRCIAIDEKGNVLVGDSGTREIYRLSADGKPEAITGGKVGIPMDLAVAPDGTIYVADLETRTVMKIAPGEKEPKAIASVNPRGLFLDSSGLLWVVSQDKQPLVTVAADGKVEAVVTERLFEFPHQVVVDTDGVAWVSDGYGKCVWKIAKGGKPEKVHQGDPLVNPVGMALMGSDKLVVDPRASKVFKLGSDLKLQEYISVVSQ